MMTPSLLIVTDRGGLRAYKVEPNPSRPPAFHLIDSFETPEAHGRYDDKVTDQAGRFKASGMPNQQTGGTASHNTIDLENDRRACKHVAARINELVKREKPESWFLAVPKPIHHLVMDGLDRQVATFLTDTAYVDLVRVDPSKLAAHFPALQHA